MQDMQDYLQIAENNEVYKNWKKEHPKAYLSYFAINGDDYQVGFYNTETTKVFSVSMTEDKKVINAWEDDVFKEPDKEIKQLTLQELKLSSVEIKEKANTYFNEKYKNMQILKTIYVLENTEDFGIAWNVTFAMGSWVLIIIKIDPNNGKILDEKKTTLTA